VASPSARARDSSRRGRSLFRIRSRAAFADVYTYITPVFPMYSSSRAARPLPPPPALPSTPGPPGPRSVDATVVVHLPRAAGDVSLSLSLSLSLVCYTPRELSLFSELSPLFPAISPGNFIILSVPLLHSAISISVNLGLLSGRPL